MMMMIANDLFMQDHIMSFSSPARYDLFFQRGDGLIDIRLFVIALSTVHRPSQAMETLKLAFKMFESEVNGYVLEEDLAAILEIMLGVRELDLSSLFSALNGPETAKITYGETSSHLCLFRS
ncbi:lysophosphatidylcholine acyltransferase 1-like, partial [Notothenia coriiceps]|uniref:Lysophosphatidylcholine acyltransferase 1-like n=1 Tax=Notothenia coriiceps TaxID=8208 RepID=A0A6I9PA61_9TELE